MTETSNLFQTEAILLALFIIIILVGLVARFFRLPYTSILVVVGLSTEFLGVLPHIELTPELVLLLFLPPLAFEAAFHLDFDTLRQDLVSMSTFALLGVIITMLVAGAILVMGLGMPLELALLFGALIAATDPVSVVAVFRELGVSKRLSTLVEGESLFNDGTSIVLFRLVLVVVLTGTLNPASSVADFLRLVVGGLALGFGLGYLVSRVLIRFDDYLIEISLTVILAWGSYLLGEYLGVSGVISTVVAGLVLGNYGGRISFSPTTKIVLEHVLEFISFVANSFIFLLIGLQVGLLDIRTLWQPILWAIAAALIARAGAVYGLSFLLNLVTKPIPSKWQHLLFWGGLRGGVTLALALSLPINVPQRSTLIVAAFGVVLFTLVVQGLTVRPLVEWLGLAPREQEQLAFETMRARLLALHTAKHRLKHLHDGGEITEAAYEKVRQEYEKQAQALEENLQVLYAKNPRLRQREINAARLEGLRVQRSELFSLNRRGLITDKVYRDLTSEIDSELETLTQTPAERRAIEAGPEVAEDTNTA